jgi:hypothetical protein
MEKRINRVFVHHGRKKTPVKTAPNQSNELVYQNGICRLTTLSYQNVYIIAIDLLFVQ